MVLPWTAGFEEFVSEQHRAAAAAATPRTLGLPLPTLPDAPAPWSPSVDIMLARWHPDLADFADVVDGTWQWVGIDPVCGWQRPPQPGDGLVLTVPNPALVRGEGARLSEAGDTPQQHPARIPVPQSCCGRPISVDDPVMVFGRGGGHSCLGMCAICLGGGTDGCAGHLAYTVPLRGSLLERWQAHARGYAPLDWLGAPHPEAWLGCGLRDGPVLGLCVFQGRAG